LFQNFDDIGDKGASVGWSYVGGKRIVRPPAAYCKQDGFIMLMGSRDNRLNPVRIEILTRYNGR
jgi:hypothetical protein